MSQGQLIGLLNREAQAGDTVVAASGGPPGDLLKLWDASGGRRCHLEFGYSCMGYEVPAGLGVRLAQPTGEVFVLIGDGTYLMNPTELVTAVQEGLKITVIVSENHGYQCIRRLQMWRTGISFGNEFRHRDPATNRLEGEYLGFDLAANAASWGARAWHVTTLDQLEQALRQARAETRPCVIVAEVEKHRVLPGGGCWWDVAPAEVSQDPKTQELRAEYERDKARFQRLHY
jgi:3D-(3,5/4)-trihydroxycyclohexane-1,2-dione acylhydrolase (decyclizing)